MMKPRVVVVALLLLFVCGGVYAKDSDLVKGRVLCDGRAVSGVVVTDGVNSVETDARGRYLFKLADDSRFVYISTPSNYVTKTDNGVSRFYYKIDPSRGVYDFELTRKSADDTKHGFVAVADAQVWHQKEFALLQSAADDIRQTIASHEGVPFHGIGCGDIVSNDHSFYDRYNNVMTSSGATFFNAMGNHDMVNYGRSFETSQSKFEQTFGPSYYSFNVGKVHYVVLNNNFYVGRDYFYIGYLPERQMAWLERDLGYVEPGSTVVVCLHIPTSCTPEDRKRFEYATSGLVTANHRGLYKILEPYNAHIVSGHTHTMFNQQISPRLYEHVTAAVSGAWWQGSLCTDGTPCGYGVYMVDGDSISWYYKSTGFPKEYQFQLYDGREYPEFKGYVVANVWNSDPAWRVELYRNGAFKGKMEQFKAYDPKARIMYSNTEKLDHKWIYPSESDHFYRVAVADDDTDLEVVATDRFGNVSRAKIR